MGNAAEARITTSVMTQRSCHYVNYNYSIAATRALINASATKYAVIQLLCPHLTCKLAIL